MFTQDTTIVTAQGLKPIVHVQAGDLVMTHKRRWREVTGVYCDRRETIELHGIATVRCTPETLLYSEGEWVFAKDMSQRCGAMPIISIEGGGHITALYSIAHLIAKDYLDLYVRTIVKGSIETVYSLTVDDDNSYIAGTYIVRT